MICIQIKLYCIPFYRVLCFQRGSWGWYWKEKGLVKEICFAVKASRGLELLFPLCLAASASQSNQKLIFYCCCQLWRNGWNTWVFLHPHPHLHPHYSSFTLMATSAASSLPLLHLALYQMGLKGGFLPLLLSGLCILWGLYNDVTTLSQIFLSLLFSFFHLLSNEAVVYGVGS